MHSNSNNSTVFVRGYSESVSRQQIEGIFERFGTIREVKMIKNFAFVSYANQESANAAAEQLHNTSIKGDKLTVEISGRPKPRREPRLSRVNEGDKCNACGKQGHWARHCPQKASHQRPQRSPRQRSRQRNNDKREKKPDHRRRQRSPLSSSSSSSSSSSGDFRKRRDERKGRKSYSSSSNSSSSSSRSSSSPSSKE